MGMTIEESKRNLSYAIKWKDRPTDESMMLALDIMSKYQMMQADYEAKLRADMIAMLEDLDLQIDESAAYNREVAKVQRLIRDRIVKLKEDKE